MTDQRIVPTPQVAVELLGPPEIRQLAQQLEVNPTKKLGQNFVLDPNTVRKIVADATVGAADDVVEIGPGLGSLTLALLERARTVTAVEIDPRLAGYLPTTIAAHTSPDATQPAETVEEPGQRAGGSANSASDPGQPADAPAHPAGRGIAPFHVIERDALRITRADFVAAGRPQPTALVANLPYNVSVPVLLHFLEEFPTIQRVLVMVQLEVADRLAASPGTKTYGVPSVKARFYGHAQRTAVIGKNVFWPAPKVDSGLVRLDRWTAETRPWDAGVDEPQLRRTVFDLADAAFLQRRKTLRAALSRYFGGAAAAEEVLCAAGIDPQQRGEKLSAEDYVRLAQATLGHAASAAHNTPANPPAGGC